MQENSQKGFTLIEMAIVMVVIGLAIGGVVVGKDLINAAAIHSQLAQIENIMLELIRSSLNLMAVYPEILKTPMLQPSVLYQEEQYKAKVMAMVEY